MDGTGPQKRQLGYAIVLGAVAIAILILGFAFKPRESPKQSREGLETAAVLAQIQSLREIAQRNSLRNTSNRFADLAQGDSKFLMQADGEYSTQVMWSSDGLALAASDRFPSTLGLRYGDQAAKASPVSWSADFPFSLYRVTGIDIAPPAVMHSSELRVGMWVIASAVGSGGNVFATAMYGGLGTTTCQGKDYAKLLLNAPLQKEYVGAGAFSIDGSLLAVVTRCDNEIAAVPVDQIDSALSKIKSSAHAACKRLGFDVQPLSPALSPLLGADRGLVVTDTWLGWPAQQAGLAPGDVIIEINGDAVNSIADAAAAMQNTPLRFQIRRGKATLSITLDPAATPAASTLQLQAGGIVVTDAASRTMQDSEIRSGDRILQIDRRDASEQNALRPLTRPSGKPALLVVQRGPRLFFSVWP